MSSILDWLGIGVDEIEFTEEELKAQEIAFDNLVNADAEGKELTPFIEATMGLTRDEGGNLRNMTGDEFYASLDPINQQNYDNLTLQLERQNRALKGELPESEVLQKQKEDAFELTKQSLAERGLAIEGDDLESAVGLSTPAIQTLEALKSEFGLRADTERRDIIKTGNANILGNIATTSDINQRKLSNLETFPQRRSSVLSGASQVQQPYASQSGSNAQVQSANSAINSALYGTLGAIGYGLLTQ